MRRTLPVVLAMAGALVFAACSRQNSTTAAAGPRKLGRLPIGGDFALTNQDGAKFELAQQRGKIVLLFFGYASCTEACPIALTKVKSAYQKLGADAERVQTIFVSLDPKRDTPAALKSYLEYFKVGAIGLTGKKEELDAVAKLYGASYEIEKTDSALEYHLKHSTFLYLLDGQGAVRERYLHSDNSDRIVEGIRLLLAEK